MRRMISKSSQEWIKELKENVVADGTKTEVGGDLDVDGKIAANGFEVNSEDDVNINAPTDIHGRLYVDGKVEIGNNVEPGAVKDLVVSGKIQQNTPNYSFDINLTAGVPDEIDAVLTYGKAIVYNNIMYIVIAIKLTNNTESAISIPNIQFQTNDLPEEIRALIYDCDGDNMLVSKTWGAITSETLYKKSDDPNDVTYSLDTGNFGVARRNNRLFCGMYPASLSINSGKTRYLTSRVFILL